jgi:hypothetical protein
MFHLVIDIEPDPMLRLCTNCILVIDDIQMLIDTDIVNQGLNFVRC